MQKNIFKLLFAVAIAFFAACANSTEFKWYSEADAGIIFIKVIVPEHFYLYEDKTSVELSDASGKEILVSEKPSVLDYKDEYGENYSIYSAGEHVWKFSAPALFPCKAEIKYQGCSKKPFVCYPPANMEFYVNKKNTEADLITPEKKLSPASGDEKPDAHGNTEILQKGFITGLLSRGGIWLVIAAFLGGLLSSLTPCVLPLIPVTLAILGADKDAGRGKALRRSLLYVSGIIITFTALAVFASFSGKAFGSQILGNPILLLVLALLMTSLGLSMLGVFELQLPSSMQMRLNRVGGGTDAGAFLMGLVAGVIAVPCTGPVLATLLGFLVILGNPVFGVFLLATYAVGFSVIFIAIGTGFAKVPRSGTYMDAVKSILGIAILIISFFAFFIAFPAVRSFLVEIFTNSIFFPLALVVAGAIAGAVHSDPHSSRASVRHLKIAGAFILAFGLYWLLVFHVGGKIEEIKWHSSIEDGLHQASIGTKPVLVDFTAEWCVACKEMELLTFRDSAIVRKLNDEWIPVRMDCTLDTPETEQILKRYKISGFPSVLLLSPDGIQLSLLSGFISHEELLLILEEKEKNTKQ